MSSLIVKEEPGKKLTVPQQKLLKKQIDSTIAIQKTIRRFLGHSKVRRVAQKTWQRVYDPRFKLYFWYNRLNGGSQWHVPRFMELYKEEDVRAAELMCKAARGFLGRMRARKMVHSKYTRYYDSRLNKYYWSLNETGATTWKASSWLQRQNVPLPPEDEMLYEATMKIKELEKKLKEKDNEIKQVRLKRFEELEPEVLKDRVGNAKLLVRPKQMDEWTIDELCAWMIELKMEEYIAFFQKNRVDGYLFINLSDDEWPDMGINSRFHTRKLQLAMKPFRIKYENKKNKIDDEDADLISEYANSELSDIVRGEQGADADDSGSGSDSDSSDSYSSDEEEKIELTAEQKQEIALDNANIHIEKIINGDGINFPMIGDVVRIRYVCSMISNSKVVTSTKNGIKRKVVEFVLGIGQTIKGFDRGLPKMSIGERSKIMLTAEYAYGKDGLFPHIPPNAELMFNVTLLGFRPRIAWIKRLLQEPGLSQKPYWEGNPEDFSFKEGEEDDL